MDKESSEKSGNKPSVIGNIEPNDRIIDALEADNKQSSIDLDISKIRERTFNKELSELVEKIKSNEETVNDKRAGETIIQENEDTDISEGQLLIRLHKLFYKSFNLTEIDNINTEFNPFVLYKESSSDDLDILIKTEMNRISLPEYAILIYNMEKKCYICYVNNIKGLDDNNIILDTSERLFSDIMKNKNVYILDYNAIERDVYLRKRFTIAEDKQKKSKLLFISFSSLFENFFFNIEIEGISSFLNNILPVIMIRINDKIGDHQKKDIYNKIKTNLTVYFFLLYKKILIDIQKTFSININNVLNYLDYEYKKYITNKDGVCYIINYKNYINIEFLYILEYLYNKLRQTLSEHSTISRVEKDKIIIFTQNSKRKILDQVLEDFNKIYGNIFNVKLFSDDELNRRNIGAYLLFHE